MRGRRPDASRRRRAPMTDLVIRGGTVLDGTGAPGRRADVAIRGERIEAIGANLRGRRELDASGQVVAPGFIDIHTHYDAQVFWDPALTPSCFHGVTTVIAGNCGFSIAPTRPAHRSVVARTLEQVEDMTVETLGAGIPWDFESFAEYLGSVRRHGTVLNFTAYVGHTALRLYALGEEAYERAARPAEVDAMCAALRAGLEAGAAGLATSFAPTHVGMHVRGRPPRRRRAAASRGGARVCACAREIRPGRPTPPAARPPPPPRGPAPPPTPAPPARRPGPAPPGRPSPHGSRPAATRLRVG